MVVGSTGNGRQFRSRRGLSPWNRPQSTRSASLRLDEVPRSCHRADAAEKGQFDFRAPWIRSWSQSLLQG